MERPDLIDVLVVDGHEMVAQGLALVLSSDPAINVLGTAGTIEEAVLQCAAAAPHVVLVDADMPDGDAVDAIARVSAVASKARIVMMTGAADDQSLAVAVDAGYLGYVNKKATGNELLDAVKAAAAGDAYFSPYALARLLYERRTAAKALHSLPQREREVLQMLADGRSVADMADRLRLSTHTVRNHIRRAMKHLGVHTRLDAVVAAARAGVLTVEGSGAGRASLAELPQR
jgi:DNA-binding NarL/FixJ family response regulator